MSDNRTLTFTIAGDARRLESSLNRATNAVQHSATSFERAQHTVRHVAEAFALLEGAHLAIDFLHEATHAAMEDETAMARVGVAVRNSHENWNQLKQPISEALSKMSATSGFMKTELADSFSRLETTTGDYHKSLTLLGDAENIAAARHISVNAAAMTLQRTYNGSATALKRLGITMAPVTTAEDELKQKHDALIASGAHLTAAQTQEYHAALATAAAHDHQATSTEALQLIHERFAGSVEARSETMAGKIAIFGAQWEEVKVRVGEAILPLLTTAMGLVTDAMNFLGTNQSVQRVFADIQAKGQQLSEWIHANWPQIKAITIEVFNAIDTAWNTILRPALVAIGALIGSLVGLIQEHWAAIRSATETVFNAIAGIVGPQLRGIRDTIRLVTDLIKGDWGGAWGDIKNMVGDTLDTIKGTLRGAASILGGIAETVGGAIYHGLLNALSSLGSSLVSSIKGAINSLIDQANSALTFDVKVDTHIPGVGTQGFTVNPPDIPHLALGGLVRSRPGGTLALLGEGGEDELVTPVSRAGGVLGGVVVHNYNLRADVSGREVAQNLSFLIRRSLPAV